MHSTNSNRQREALMALKDGPMPVLAFNTAHSGHHTFQVDPNLIEFDQRDTLDGIESIVRLTQIGHSVLAEQARHSAAATRMAGETIDQLGDPSASAEDREARKHRLLRGPMEFRATT
jgi:hypothetical protein